MIRSFIGVLGLGMIGFFLKSNKPIVMTEICDNAIDDDGDGLIDLNDNDCICEIIRPVSLIPNPSFEDRTCCPNSRSQLNCASVWIQASEPTTDYLHTCGWMGWPEFPPPLPFPDGEGIVGFRDGRVGQNGNNPEPSWKEYAGACLLSPLLANQTYRFEFFIGFVDGNASPPINVTFFGTTDCVNLPFGKGNQRLGCPTNGPNWINLGSKLVDGGGKNVWIRTSIEIKPSVNIAAIAIGPDCPDVISPVSTYYFFDNLVLADLFSFQFQISEISHPCSDRFLLSVPSLPGFKYQWYKNGIALIGETSSKLKQMHGEGDYQTRIIDNTGSCKISTAYKHNKPITYNYAIKTICKDDKYNFGNQILTSSGTYRDTFKSVNNCDSVVTLALHVLGLEEDTLSVSIFEGDSYQIGRESYSKKGDYLVHLTSSAGCDSLLLLKLDYYHLFFPNIFTPNGDGRNDFFSAFGDTDLTEHVQFSIYDRWGNNIYQGNQWDGKSTHNQINPGVYTYLAHITLTNGRKKIFSGSVTLVL